MPKIIKNTAQTKALAEIDADLSIVREINEIIFAGYSGQMDVVVNPEEGRRCKAKVMTEYRYHVMVALAREKKALSRQILSKARRFHIELSEYELNSLSDLPVPKDRSAETVSLEEYEDEVHESETETYLQDDDGSMDWQNCVNKNEIEADEEQNETSG